MATDTQKQLVAIVKDLQAANAEISEKLYYKLRFLTETDIESMPPQGCVLIALGRAKRTHNSSWTHRNI